MFCVITKRQILLTICLALTLVTAFCCFFISKASDEALCFNYLKALGYSPEDAPSETADVKIPEGFGKVYENYNLLQKEAGFDLTPFRGCTVKRYTFRLTDSPLPLANILVYENKICGGDILDPSSDGKIQPLIQNKE